ncbi:MAG: DNA polymerase III subunit gamma/tau [Loigolactobacillus coryniformis]|uniref:DNA polymerase III subunit gamma/tau n=1 Tax=Loigolactobacillus coryniformis TaxID=1610 RepID=UPI0026474DDA|nr:DNA polymerase III subunit gamma/tau [Loigolactobacillus coryniformis]MDN5953619.1 DNA polymerase III subunit gamma/tau [Loigolactobacillus coryniformis]
MGLAYQALYRVWRPQRFADIVGQETITQTLRNALEAHQTSHAYLFTGPRGTGKTSAAKIFAKAINCPNLKDGEPCNECPTCQAITAGTLNDVIEIDAASNNGVDEIRDIRDKAKYAPTSAPFKVYIIDEVHMLSTGAFNALLKTLEEPPSHVVFILATTEPHKVPLTIISRTQRFDFQRISAQAIYSRMSYILQEKEITFEEPALKTIAKAAEGGMRDALSVLDQVLSFSDNHVTLDNALQVTGSAAQQLLADYMQAVQSHDTPQALELLQQVLAAGKDAGRFIEDLIEYSRDLLLYQQAPAMVEKIELGSIDDQFKQLSQAFAADELYRVIDVLNDSQQQLRFTNHPDIYLEVASVKLCQTPTVTVAAAATPETTAELSQLQQELKTLHQQLATLQTNGAATPQTTAPAQTPPRRASKQHTNVAAIYPILDHATKDSLQQLKSVWAELLQMLTVQHRALMHASKPVAASHDGVVVSFDSDFLLDRANSNQAMVDSLENGLDRLVGYTPKIIFVPQDEWPQVRKSYIQQHQRTKQPTEQAAETKVAPVVSQAEALFGSENIEIKND